MTNRRNLPRLTALAVGLLFMLPLALTACGDEDGDGDGGSESASGIISVTDVWSRPAILLDGDGGGDGHDGDHDEDDDEHDDDHEGDSGHDGSGTNGVVYMRIENQGEEADRLTGASSEIAGAAELHTTNMADGVMQMRQAEDGVEIPAGETVAFEQGGYHVMLIGLHEALVEGESFEVELTFEHAGTITVESEVRAEQGG